MEKQERVRLLIVEGEDSIKGRGGRISHGAASLVSRWPGYIASAIWFLIFVISIVTIFMLLIFMLLVKEERRMLGNRSIFPKNNQKSHKLNNEFCREMTSGTNQGKREMPNIEMFNTGNNIFYVRTKPLNKPSSCSAESVLRNTKNKNVFIMMFDQYQLDYENELKHRYPNLILSKVDGTKYLKGTPFTWEKDNQIKSIIAAGLVTIWQFGGMVLSDNLMACNNIDNITDSDTMGGSCKIDYELLSCAEQCSGFVYDFINALIDNNMQDGAAPIVEKSIVKFCGNGVRDCDGARRARHICDTPASEPDCQFARLDNWLDKDVNWKSIKKYCPITDRHSRLKDRSSTENITTIPTSASLNVTQSINIFTTDGKMTVAQSVLNTSVMSNINSTAPLNLK